MISENNEIELTWNSPEDEIKGYFIYKLDAVTKKYRRLNNQIIKDNNYTDISAEQGKNYYMVRALQLTKSASGSYYNLSQGVFDTIYFIHQKPVHPSDINLADAEVLPYSVFKEEVNPQVQEEVEEITPVSEFEKNFLVYPNPSNGLYNVRFGSKPVNYAEFYIYNLQGHIIQSENFFKTTTGRFDISRFSKGIYIVKGTIDGNGIYAKIFLE